MRQFALQLLQLLVQPLGPRQFQGVLKYQHVLTAFDLSLLQVLQALLQAQDVLRDEFRICTLPFSMVAINASG